MTYEIEQRKVIGVVQETNNALQGKGFNHGEVILGLSELIGRMVVDACQNHIQAKQMYDIAVAHINKTISIGNHASGKSLIEKA